jgi:hypothetical protein
MSISGGLVFFSITVTIAINSRCPAFTSSILRNKLSMALIIPASQLPVLEDAGNKKTNRIRCNEIKIV